MKKRIVSFLLTLCIVASLVLILPNNAMFTSANAAYNYSGGTRNSAVFILDPGHGGSDPGACSLGRQEAADVLDLSIRIAKLIDNSGSTCSLTRVTDVTQSLATKVSIANSGSFTYFLSVHRNAGGGKGIETYYSSTLSSSSTACKLATSVQNALIATGLWTNRGVKTAAYYVVKYTDMAAALVEVGFIDTATDNTIFANYLDTHAKAIANGLLAMIGKSVTEAKTVVAPTVTVDSTVAYNTALSVSWGAVTNATSYKYSVVTYAGEPSATSATTVVSSTSTTGTSFTVPAQSSGKYMKITVTAVGPQNSQSTTKTVLMGPYVGYPSTVQYIPVADINGSTASSNSTIWTSSKGSTFSAVYWRALLCSPNSDGTYTVKTIYEYKESKSVTVSGTDILFAIHSSYTNYNYAAEIVVGDKLTLCGIYLDSAKIRGSGHILVNGGKSLTVSAPTVSCPSEVEIGSTANITWATVTNATSYNYKVVDNNGNVITEASGVTAKSFTIPAVDNGTSLTVTVTAVGPVNSQTTTKTITLKLNAPQDITSAKSTIQKTTTGKAFRGFDERSTASTVLGSFNEDSDFLVIYDTNGNEVANTDMVATGYTVNVVVNGNVTVTYSLVVTGDVTGDGVVSSADYVAESKALKNTLSLDGAFALALDYNCDDTISSLDIIALKNHIS